MTECNIIAAAYDAGVDEEYKRLVSSPLREVEFELITKFLSDYISYGSTVIDIGTGPGRYAEFLLSRKCKIGTVDLSEKSLEFFGNRISETYKNQILFNKTCCATNLEWIESETADAILLMGPMYHLVSHDERVSAIKHAYRILKKDGFIFSVFMSPYPLLNPLMESKVELLNNKNFLKSIDTECITKVNFQGYEIEQFRCWPSYATKIMTNEGFIKHNICNIEGIGCFLKNTNNSSYDDFKNFLLNAITNTCEKPNLLGITEQYLYIGKK